MAVNATVAVLHHVRYRRVWIALGLRRPGVLLQCKRHTQHRGGAECYTGHDASHCAQRELVHRWLQWVVAVVGRGLAIFSTAGMCSS